MTETQGPSQQDINILHIDDDVDSLKITKMVLESKNPRLRVTSVASSKDALQELGARSYDCIVTDFVMPELDGLQLARRVREFSDTPIILYTGQGSEDVAEQAFKLGVDGYVKKEIHPAHYQVLAQNIQNTVERHRGVTRLRESEKQLRSILDNMLEGCQIIDRQYRYLYLNDVALRHGRRAREELLGRTMTECYPGIEKTEMFRVLTECIRDATPARMENVFEYPGGLKAWFELSFEPIPDGVFILSIEASERKRVEEELRVSEAKHRLLVNEMDDIVWTLDLNLRTTYASPSIEKILGFTPEERLQQSVTSQLAPESLKLVQVVVERELSLEQQGVGDPERSVTLDLEYYHKDGSTRWLENVVSGLRNVEGKLVGFHGVSRDITERKIAGQRLLESEQRYTSLVESSPLPMGVTIGDVIVYVNRKALNLLGVTDPERLVGSSALDLIHPNDRIKINTLFLARAGGEAAASFARFRMTKADGSTIYVEDHFSDSVWEGKEAVIHGLIDVTERVLHEERLHELHSHAANLAKAEDVQDIAVITLNTIKRILGFTSASFGVVQGDWLRIVHALELGETFTPAFRLDGPGITVRAVNTCQVQLVGDTRLDPSYVSEYADNLSRVHLSELDVPVTLDGKAAAVINIEHERVDAFTSADVSILGLLAEHVSSALERLREQERRSSYARRLEMLHRHAHRLAVATSTLEVGKITFSIIEEVLGFNAGDFSLVRESYVESVYAHGLTVGEKGVLPLGGSGVTVRAARTGETQMVPDTRAEPDYVGVDIGGTRTLSEMAVPVKVDGRVVAVINLESVELGRFTETDRVLVEIMAQHVASVFERARHLEHVQGMERAKAREAVENAARLSSMMRHDLRGPLTAVRNAVYMLRHDPADADLLDVIDRSVSRATEILDELRERTWTGNITPVLADIVALVRETVEGLGAPEGVTVEFRFSDEVVYGRVDGAKMRRVVENLVFNAFDAMPYGGSLSVEEWTGEGALVLRFSDTGVGIAAENLSRVFAPFYTTKATGMGLGLTYCQQVVEAHGGEVGVDSVVGEGTSFTVRLPLSGSGVCQLSSSACPAEP